MADECYDFAEGAKFARAMNQWNAVGKAAEAGRPAQVQDSEWHEDSQDIWHVVEDTGQYSG